MRVAFAGALALAAAMVPAAGAQAAIVEAVPSPEGDAVEMTVIDTGDHDDDLIVDVGVAGLVIPIV